LIEIDHSCIFTDENRLETYNELANVGCPTLVIETDSLDQVERAWLLLGEATGTLSAAVEQRNKIIAVRVRNRAALCGIARISTLILVWRDPWIASGSGTYPDALLSECGFRNVLCGVGKEMGEGRYRWSPTAWNALIAGEAGD
jgi:ABC-type Fe3+-hydroxamate transport system substrate-binding protein